MSAYTPAEMRGDALLRKSGLSGRWYCVTEYDRVAGNVVARRRYDVTEEMEAVIAVRLTDLRARLSRSDSTVSDLQELAIHYAHLATQADEEIASADSDELPRIVAERAIYSDVADSLRTILYPKKGGK